MKDNKVLVTGAAGLLGSNIVRMLIDKQYEPVCFVQNGTSAKTLEGLNVKIVYGDILETPTIEKALNGCSFVIHAAACTAIWPYRNPDVRRTNYDGTIQVADAARRLGIRRFVHIGSASSFDYGTKEQPGSESSQFSGWKFGLDYINTKYLSQKYLLGLHAMYGFPVVIISPTFMIGAFDSGPTSGRLLLNYLRGKLPGYTCGGKNFVNAMDVALAAVNALKSGSNGDCYIAGGENLSYREFFEIAAVVAGRKFDLKPIPHRLICTYAKLNSVIAGISGREPSISYRSARISRETQFYSNEKMKRELNVATTPIQFAIRNSIQWFTEHGYV